MWLPSCRVIGSRSKYALGILEIRGTYKNVDHQYNTDIIEIGLKVLLGEFLAQIYSRVLT